MPFLPLTDVNINDVAELVRETFTHSEGPEEGNLIGRLIHQLHDTTPEGEWLGFVAIDNSVLAGAVFFSRLTYPTMPNTALLSPMAVHPSYQKQGLGQSLIQHGLTVLKTQGYQLVMTYGDPAFYGRVGFTPTTPDTIQPPHHLSYPHGWLAQSLTDAPLTALRGKPSCVPAFNCADLW
jgi:predicted N-acetyltransferase YhbS